jgi:hypothetical protein
MWSGAPTCTQSPTERRSRSPGGSRIYDGGPVKGSGGGIKNHPRSQEPGRSSRPDTGHGDAGAPEQWGTGAPEHRFSVSPAYPCCLGKSAASTTRRIAKGEGRRANFGLRIANCEIRNPKFAIHDPKFAIRNPQCEMRFRTAPGPRKRLATAAEVAWKPTPPSGGWECHVKITLHHNRKAT